MTEDKLFQFVKLLHPEPAILARRLMLLEVHTRQTIYDHVFWASENMIKAQINFSPQLLTASASEPFRLLPDSPGLQVHVDLILPNSTVVFLGSVLDQRLSLDLWQYYLKLSRRAFPDKHATIKRSGPLAIRRDAWLCALPTSSQVLDLATLTAAVQRYFNLYLPALSSVPLHWLNEQSVSLAHGLAQYFNRQAERTASPELNIKLMSQKQLLRQLAKDIEKPAT